MSKKMEIQKQSNRKALQHLFTVLTLAVTVISVADTKSIARIETANAIVVNPIVNSGHTVQSNFKETLIQLSSKYKDSLFNQRILPFLANCTNVLTTTSPSSAPSSPSMGLSNDNLLCSVYYDMAYNLGKSGFIDYQTEQSVVDTLTFYDNATLANNFCTFFAGEIPTERENRPFESQLGYNNISAGQILKATQTCSLFCCEMELYQVKIRPICKLISGGYRVLNKHQIDKDVAITEKVQKPMITEIAVGQAVAAVPAQSAEPAVLAVPAIPAVPAVVDAATKELPAPIVVQATAEPTNAPAIPQEEPKPDTGVANIELVKNVSAPNLAVSAPSYINQTSDPIVVPISSEKPVTKEMKPSLNIPETVPFQEAEAEAEKDTNHEVPDDDDESEYPNGNFYPEPPFPIKQSNHLMLIVIDFSFRTD